MSEGGLVAFGGRFLDALIAGDRRAAEETINDAIHAGFDGIAVLDELLTPAMHEVGRRWQHNQISIADEHLATAIAHSTLTRIYPTLVASDARTRGVVLLAGADGEQHVLGLRMVADVLEANGFDVRNIGAALPPDSLARAVRRHRPVLVGLANTVVGDRPALQTSVRAVRTVAPRVPILLGGAAAPTGELDDLVVVCRSAREALAAAERLVDPGGGTVEAA